MRLRAFMPLAAAAALLLGSGAANAQQVGGFDSGTKAAVSCTGAPTISSGQALCNLLQIPLARYAGQSGEIENLLWISAGGDTTAKLVRIWDVQPTHTTCTGGQAFVSNFADDLHLVTPPISLSPSAPAVTTGDAKTYATASFAPPISYANQDASPTAYVYACVTAGASDTADANGQVGLVLSGPRN